MFYINIYVLLLFVIQHILYNTMYSGLHSGLEEINVLPLRANYFLFFSFKAQVSGADLLLTLPNWVIRVLFTTMEAMQTSASLVFFIINFLFELQIKIHSHHLNPPPEERLFLDV